MGAIAHTWFMAERNLRALMRQPWWIVISLVQPVTYLLTFLSPVFIEPALMPGWIRTVSRFNPVAWSVEAARSALSPAPDWGLIATRMGLLVLLSIASAWLAARAFRAYQRSA